MAPPGGGGFRFRPGGRLGSSVYGGQPLALAQATTLPASAVAATSASLNGAVNPRGLATSWWFAWGTTPQYGNVTATVAAGAGTVPVTVGANLVGLSTGATYHFAMVAQSAAGTVYGADTTFVAQTAQQVTNALIPLQPTSPPAASIPHFAYPFALSNSGAAVVEQDSLGEVFACVQAIANCPSGACPELPGFGVPDLAFGQAPPDTAQLVGAITRWEPRATEQAVAQALGNDPDSGGWQVTLTTQTRGTSEGS